MSAEKRLLDALREDRARNYKAAGDDGSLRLLRLVAVELGKEMPARYGPKWQWSGEDVHVYRDEYGGYTTVVAGGRQVCNTHPNVQLYVPGEWLDQVKQGASLELQTARDDDKGRNADLRQELLERLGLKGIPAIPLPDEDIIADE